MRLRTAAIAFGVFYLLVCLTIYFATSAIPELPAASSIPKPVGIFLVSVIGPAVWLGAGSMGLPAFAMLMLLVLVCFIVSRNLYKRTESEAFAFPLFAVAVIWIASGWLAVAAAFVITS